MRTQIIEKIHALMKKEKNIYFLTADLGYSVLEQIEKDFPDRFLNMGVAEQNMIGTAAGLALSGKIVFVYSIIPFVTMRCLEQIRDDICYHNLNVKIIGVGSGLSYGILGGTHFALEDIGIMRSLAKMVVISPVDAVEAAQSIEKVCYTNGPVYFRIGKKDEPEVFKKPYKYEIGKAQVLKKGKDISIISTGTIFSEALQAEKILREKHHITSDLIDMHTIKPIDSETITNLSRNKMAIFTVEEHSMIGGLGSAVAEVLSSQKNSPPLIRIGTEDNFVKYVGSQTYLRKKLGLTAEAIVEKIISYLKKNT